MPSIEHPSLGLLVPDAWGEHVTLRKFPFLPEFARGERATDKKDLTLIRDWEQHIDVLGPRAREFGLRDGLHREGIFEVYVEFRKGESPTQAQEVAIASFIADEQQICRNLVDAMLRYYGAARCEIPDWFESPPSSGDEFPQDPAAVGLATVLDFDCLTIPRTEVASVAPLLFSWSPAWDEEHGLLSLVYDSQVLSIGTDEVRDMADSPSDDSFTLVWNRSIMTPPEIAAYEAYRRAYESK